MNTNTKTETEINIEHTPIIKQYLQIKAEYPEYLLLYRMGDFYELFFADAIKAAKLLDLTLTKRGKTAGQPIEMAGVPQHTVEYYIQRLIKLGETVVICEQLGEPNSKGLIERKVTRVISPGTITEEELLPYKQANLIMAILAQNHDFGIAALDLSTSWFNISKISNVIDLAGEIERLQPKEIIIPQHSMFLPKFTNNIPVNYLEQLVFTEKQAKSILNQQFGTNFYQDFIKQHQLAANLADKAGLIAAGALLHYVKSRYQHNLLHLNHLKIEHLEDSIIIDQQTRRNLEITTNLQTQQSDGAKSHTVLGVLDDCKTAMGSRLLFNWLNRPIKDHAILNKRYAAIKALQLNYFFEKIDQILINICDLERVVTRVATATAKPRDLLQLKQTFEILPDLMHLLHSLNPSSDLLKSIMENLHTFTDSLQLLARAIVDNPPILLKEGNFIAKGYDQELDQLRNIYTDADLFLQQIEQTEKAKTKLSTLKIGFNKIHGYYIEVSRNQSKLLPSSYTRRQTLKNVERFISPELKTLEDQILSSKTRAIAREKILFMQILQQLQQKILSMQATATALAELDVLNNLARRAVILNWSEPCLTSETTINIVAGRHPVIETIGNINFIANNLEFNSNKNMYVITGPNMGGKSTYMRQNALIILLAHIGSFVPAYQALIGPIDRIFSRIGASDDLTQGKSTFMLEMLETANILQYATANSLVIIDEIGRGTSTFDGVALAYGVAKYLVNNNKSFCLFATHFLELATLATEYKNVVNMHFTAEERQNGLEFLYKIQPGAAANSYGLQVAKLAGIPKEVIEIAKAKLLELG